MRAEVKIDPDLGDLALKKRGGNCESCICVERKEYVGKMLVLHFYVGPRTSGLLIRVVNLFGAQLHT